MKPEERPSVRAKDRRLATALQEVTQAEAVNDRLGRRAQRAATGARSSLKDGHWAEAAEAFLALARLQGTRADAYSHAAAASLAAAAACRFANGEPQEARKLAKMATRPLVLRKSRSRTTPRAARRSSRR